MAEPQKLLSVTARYNHFLPGSSDKTPAKAPSQKPAPVTQVPDSQTNAAAHGSQKVPSKEGSIVHDSIEQPQPAGQGSFGCDVESILQLEIHGSQQAQTIIQNTADGEDDLYGLSDPETSTRIHTSQSRKTVPAGTDLTTPSMAPNASTRRTGVSVAMSRKSANTTSRSKSSRSNREMAPVRIENDGDTSAVAALRKLKAGSHSDSGQQVTSTIQESFPRPSTEKLAPRISTNVSQRTGQPLKDSSTVAFQRSETIAVKKSSQPRQDSSKPKPKAQPKHKAKPHQESTQHPRGSDPTFEIPQSPVTTESKPTRDSKPKKGSKSKTDPKPSASAPSNRGKGRSSRKSIARVEDDYEDDGEDEEYSAPKTSKAKAVSSARQTRATTRSKATNFAQDDQDPPESSRHSIENAINHTTKSSKRVTVERVAHAEEGFEDFEDSVTHLNADQAAEVRIVVQPQTDTTTTLHVDKPLQPSKKLGQFANPRSIDPDPQIDDIVANMMKVKTEPAKVPPRAPGVGNRPVSYQGTTKGDPISVADDDDDDDEEEALESTSSVSNENDEAPAPKPFPQASIQRQSSQPIPPDAKQTDAANPDAVDRERAGRKPNIVSFNESGPKNQGSIRERKSGSLFPALPSHTRSQAAFRDDDAFSDSDAYVVNDYAIYPPNDQHSDGVLRRESEHDRVPQDQREHTQVGVGVAVQPVGSVPTKSERPSSLPKDNAIEISKHPVTAPALTAHTAQTQSMLGSKRAISEHTQRPTKRPKVKNTERDDHLAAGDFVSRKLSQVTDDGSPIPQGAEMLPWYSIERRVKSPGPFNLVRDRPQAAPKDPALFFPNLLVPKKSEAVDSQKDVPARHHKLPQQSSRLETSPPGKLDLLLLNPAKIAARGPQGDIFADVQESSPPKTHITQDNKGLIDALRSKAAHHISELPQNEASEEIDEEVDAMDEDDPDKTLVNDVLDEGGDSESTGSSDTDVEDEDQALMTKWRNGLKPWQSNVHEALLQIAHGFTRHLVDHETAIEDVCIDYQRGGTKLVEELEDGHESKLRNYARHVLKVKKDLMNGFKFAGDALNRDIKEIRTSYEKYGRNMQAQDNASERLDSIMQSYSQ